MVDQIKVGPFLKKLPDTEQHTTHHNLPLSLPAKMSSVTPNLPLVIHILYAIRLLIYRKIMVYNENPFSLLLQQISVEQIYGHE